jgi:hypothetical protein
MKPNRWAIQKLKAQCATSASRSMTPWQSLSKSTSDGTERERRHSERFGEVQRIVHIILACKDASPASHPLASAI